MLLLILLMLLLVAFFAAAEIAFVTASRLRVEVEARRSGRVGESVLGFLRDPASFLTTTLVGTNLALVLYSTLMAFFLEPPLRAFYDETLGWGVAGVNFGVLITQTLIASTFILVFGEIVPKSIARETANRAVFVLSLPLRACYYVFLPLIKLAGGASSALAKLFRADADTFTQFMRRDFEILLQEHREVDATPDADNNDVLSNVLALGSLRVRESMIPRPDIAAVEEKVTMEELQRVFTETQYSRLPVYRESIDQIVGIVYAYDLFSRPASVQSMLRPAYFVPETKGARELLHEMLAKNVSLAVVVDEYGGTSGLVAREDLLEELFGDIQDEYDEEEDPLIRRVGEGALIVSGRADLDTLRDRFGVDLPEGDYETVAGYLLDKLGEVPDVQEEVLLDSHRFTILKATTNRIELVRITKVKREEG